MSTFGTPQYVGSQPASPQQQVNGQAQPQPAHAGQQLPSEQPIAVVDENDPRLTSEPIEYNPQANSFASPPPPPDGKYRAKLRLEGATDAQGNKKDFIAHQTRGGNGKPVLPYYHTAISATILDPSGKYDGITVYPPFGGFVGTLQDKNGGSKISTILFRVKNAQGVPWANNFRGNHRQWMELFIKALQTEPEIGIDIHWEASCQACGEEAKAAGRSYPKGVAGMTHFPLEMSKDKAKQQGHGYSPDWPCPSNKAHGTTRARAVIGEFLSLEDLGQVGR